MVNTSKSGKCEATELRSQVISNKDECKLIFLTLCFTKLSADIWYKLSEI